MVEAEKIGAKDEVNEKLLDTSKRPEVVSVKPIKYEKFLTISKRLQPLIMLHMVIFI